MENLEELKNTVQRNLKEIFQSAAVKTEEMAKIGKLKVDILGINRRIEKQLIELGGKVYHYLVEIKEKDISNKDDVKRTVELIKSLKEDLNAKNDEITKVKQEFEEKRKEKSKKKHDIETTKDTEESDKEE